MENRGKEVIEVTIGSEERVKVVYQRFEVLMIFRKSSFESLRRTLQILYIYRVSNTLYDTE